MKLLLGGEFGKVTVGAQDCVNARDISGCTPLLYCLNSKNRVLEKVMPSPDIVSQMLVS